MENFEDFGLKMSIYSFINKYMKIYEQKMPWSFSLTFGLGFSYFDSFKHLFKKPLGYCKQISYRALGMEEMKMGSNSPGHITNKAATPIYGKTFFKNLLLQNQLTDNHKLGM